MKISGRIGLDASALSRDIEETVQLCGFLTGLIDSARIRAEIGDEFEMGGRTGACMVLSGCEYWEVRIGSPQVRRRLAAGTLGTRVGVVAGGDEVR